MVLGASKLIQTLGGENNMGSFQILRPTVQQYMPQANPSNAFANAANFGSLQADAKAKAEMAYAKAWDEGGKALSGMTKQVSNFAIQEYQETELAQAKETFLKMKDEGLRAYAEMTDASKSAEDLKVLEDNYNSKLESIYNTHTSNLSPLQQKAIKDYWGEFSLSQGRNVSNYKRKQLHQVEGVQNTAAASQLGKEIQNSISSADLTPEGTATAVDNVTISLNKMVGLNTKVMREQGLDDDTIAIHNQSVIDSQVSQAIQSSLSLKNGRLATSLLSKYEGSISAAAKKDLERSIRTFQNKAIVKSVANTLIAEAPSLTYAKDGKVKTGERKGAAITINRDGVYVVNTKALDKQLKDMQIADEEEREGYVKYITAKAEEASSRNSRNKAAMYQAQMDVVNGYVEAGNPSDALNYINNEVEDPTDRKNLMRVYKASIGSATPAEKIAMASAKLNFIDELKQNIVEHKYGNTFSVGAQENITATVMGKARELGVSFTNEEVKGLMGFAKQALSPTVVSGSQILPIMEKYYKGSKDKAKFLEEHSEELNYLKRYVSDFMVNNGVEELDSNQMEDVIREAINTKYEFSDVDEGAHLFIMPDKDVEGKGVYELREGVKEVLNNYKGEEGLSTVIENLRREFKVSSGAEYDAGREKIKSTYGLSDEQLEDIPAEMVIAYEQFMSRKPSTSRILTKSFSDYNSPIKYRGKDISTLTLYDLDKMFRTNNQK